MNIASNRRNRIFKEAETSWLRYIIGVIARNIHIRIPKYVQYKLFGLNDILEGVTRVEMES